MTQRLLNRKITDCSLKFLLVLSFTVAIVFRGFAQDASAPKATLITKFPFTTLSGGIIIVKALLDEHPDTLNFILDTGSGGISLDSAIVEYLHLVKTPSERILRGIAMIRKIIYVPNRTLHLPKLDIEHLDFHINDYTLLTSVYGVRIDGIIGYSFFSRFIVKVDYDTNMLEIYSPGKIKYPRGGIILKPTINGIPVFDATITDGVTKASRFYFDSGAGLCLLMSDNFANDSSILVKGKKVLFTQAEGIGGKKPMKLTTVKEIKIGPYRFKKVPAHIFVDDYNVTSYPTLGGLIGNDLLRRFNLIVNYADHEIHLKPNTHFRETFDYSYTGLGMYDVNGQIIIEDVMEGSPAAKAGLKPGDILAGINTVLAGNIQSYKNMLQDVGTKLKMLIVRDGELFIINLKVRSFLDKDVQ
ncbi:aspartyl protease family protein [Segetibacter aerophilus]|uniref:aspartyl protease family protein n=1 Tax=Segetibacter aerophilus TaxID=670293 RepID=UPI001FE39A79|nr:aspartyl protease family protein [Segetibacter aerophilus]